MLADLDDGRTKCGGRLTKFPQLLIVIGSYGKAQRKEFGIDGKDRVLMQAARVYISVIRNLWGAQWILGLWPIRCRTEKKCEGLLVEVYDPAS